MPKFAPVDGKTLERIFLAAGFQFVRQEGSHRSYSKPARASGGTFTLAAIDNAGGRLFH